MKKNYCIPFIRHSVVCAAITLSGSQIAGQEAKIASVISSKADVTVTDTQGFNHFLVFDRIYIQSPDDKAARYNVEVWVNNGVFIDPERVSSLNLGDDGMLVSARFFKMELASNEVLFFYIEEKDLKILVNAKAPRIKIVTDQRGISDFRIAARENFTAAIKEILISE